MRSWIWMPAELVLFVSDDGIDFREVARLGHDVADDLYDTVRRDITTELSDVEGRYVRLFARNYGTIPDLHPGRGHGGFIFVDEIFVE